MEDSFRQAVLEAAGRTDVAAALEALYQDVQKQIDLRKPVCVVSGRCCHFEEFGHRLYVTTLELAAFVRELNPLPGSPPDYQGRGQEGCPFQKEKLCTVHAIRPFGCRIYFCDATAQEWQHEQYEQFHARLRKLHDELGVPYFYAEWREALKAIYMASFTGTPNRPE